MREFLGNYKDFIETKEKVYFWTSVVFSFFILLILIASVIGITYLISFACFMWIMQAIFIGNLKANSIKLSKSQYPQAYEMAVEASTKLGYMKLPDIYVLQSGGMLNAFATRFCGKNFIVIYSDILEAAYNKGEDALKFIIAHEIAHHKRNHLLKHFLILPSCLVPFLAPAYSRACEYTCDNIATFIQPVNAIDGLLILLAGKDLYKKLSLNDYLKSSNEDSGFCTWFAEIFNSHPHLYKRIIKIISLSNSLYNNEQIEVQKSEEPVKI